MTDVPSDLSTLTPSQHASLEEASKVVDARNEAERKYREHAAEYTQLTGSLNKKLDELRDKVDALTLSTSEECEAAVVEFVAEFYDKNPLIYKDLLSPCMATVALYAVKKFLLQLENRVGDDSVETARLPSKMERFVLDPEFTTRSLYGDIVQTFEREYDSPVKVLRYRDMLHPSDAGYMAFEKFVDRDIQTWLQESAQNLLADTRSKMQSGELSEMANYNEDKLKSYCAYLENIAAGELPWGYYGEEEINDPRRTVHYSMMLDPGNEAAFAKTIDSHEFLLVQTKAAARIEAYKDLPADMREKLAPTLAHLQSIVDGTPPFGYTVVNQISPVAEDPKTQ